jgi:pimeloyl-ACP methyl ester carboxylesterase
VPELQGFEFFPLNCDKAGRLKDASELNALRDRVAGGHVTDVIFIAHGFRNDDNQATQLYSEFLRTFRDNTDRPEFADVKARRFGVAGVFWPSKTFKESFGEGAVQSLDDDEAEKQEARRKLRVMREDDVPDDQKASIDRAITLLDSVKGNRAAQDEFVRTVLTTLDTADLPPEDGVRDVRAQEGSHLLDLLDAPLLLPTDPEPEGDGGVTSPGGFGRDDGQTQGVLSVFGSVFGRIGQFLNLTTWYLMKDRAGKAGAHGTADAVRAVRAARPQIKVHLVGHSLGGRLTAACAKALADSGEAVESLTLLQAAFSHYGLSHTRRENRAGFFRPVIDRHAVRGPLVATYSMQDTVVGKAYAIASRLANDNAQAIGDENDEFGGIGRNGAQNAGDLSVTDVLHEIGVPYTFTSGKITNLNGSANLIKDHGDVTSPHITYAFASVVKST